MSMETCAWAMAGATIMGTVAASTMAIAELRSKCMREHPDAGPRDAGGACCPPPTRKATLGCERAAPLTEMLLPGSRSPERRQVRGRNRFEAGKPLGTSLPAL